MNLARRTLAPLLALAACTAQAQMPPNITDGELALLPVFCYDTLGMPKTSFTPGFEHWKARLGIGFAATHHYCWARINQRRLSLMSVDAATRLRLLGNVIDDLNYVIKHSPPNYALLPEVYSARAEVELQRGSPAAALLSIDAARKLKPSYAPPYRIWGDYLASVGKKAEARELFKTGLEYNPGDRDLRARYAALGGDPSRIQPRPVQAAASADDGASAPVPADTSASLPAAPVPAAASAPR